MGWRLLSNIFDDDDDDDVREVFASISILPNSLSLNFGKKRSLGDRKTSYPPKRKNFRSSLSLSLSLYENPEPSLSIYLPPAPTSPSCLTPSRPSWYSPTYKKRLFPLRLCFCHQLGKSNVASSIPC